LQEKAAVTIAPPVITPHSAATIVKRQNAHISTDGRATEATQSMDHCNLMAPMSDDMRLRYLSESGCDDDAIRLITRAIFDSIGKAARPALNSAALQCAKGSRNIASLLEKWPETSHFQLLTSKLNGLDEEEISLATAYAACQIYEKAATALYLAIVDGMTPITAADTPDPDTLARDQSIADAGYTDEVGRWPK